LRTALGAATLALAHKTGLAQELTAKEIPPGAVTLEDFEGLAKQRLPAQTFASVRGGAADEITVRWNREAFNRIPLRPRVLVDVSHVDTRLTDRNGLDGPTFSRRARPIGVCGSRFGAP
jgi:4-hydroxymandelate oxidase